MRIMVTSDGWLWFAGRRYRCALGRGGVHADKREGDGATPTGRYALTRLFVRTDRMGKPHTRFPVHAINPKDGWCDDPSHARYNQHVRRPFRAGHERLWRDDHRYDLILETSHNSRPAKRGYGSAIFVHVAARGYTPTEGCVALSLKDLRHLLTRWRPGTWIEIVSDGPAG